MSELNETVLAAVTGSGINDYDQRSAIGMARMWLDNPKSLKLAANPADLYAGRDQLAADLVLLMDGRERVECVEALSAARAEVNAPFLDPAMLGFQAKRLARGIVGSAKKNEKNSRV